MSYASLSDLTTFGLPASAIGPVTSGQQQSALDAASAYMDSKFRGRYRLPLIAWGAEVTQCNAELAAERVLKIRGYDPTNPGDAAIVTAADLQRAWLDAVQRQAAHPDVTESPTSPSPPIVRPELVSSSTVAVGSGASGTNRGW